MRVGACAPWLGILAFTAAAQADDLGFRFTAGKCMNATGAPGLNPMFLGQCGDLRQTDLHGKDLKGLDLRGSVLSGSDLSGADLSGAKLESASLEGADLTDARLSGADFTRATLRRADLRGYERHTGVIFRQTGLEDANLGGLILLDADFTEARMLRVQSVGTTFRNCTLDRVVGPGANFGGTAFEDGHGLEMRMDLSSWASARIENFDLGGLRAETVDFTGARLKHLGFAQAVLVNPDFSQAQFGGVDLRAAKLSGPRFNGAKLPGSSFAGTTATGAHFEGADCMACDFTSAIFEDIVLDGADLTRARLVGASFPRASLLGTLLPGAFLNGAKLVGARLRVQAPLADLSQADLTGATIRESTFIQAKAVGLLADQATVSDTQWASSDLTGASFREASVTASTFDKAILKSLKAEKSTLVGSLFRDAVLTHATLAGADLKAARLDRADLTGAILTATDLRQTYLGDSHLDGAELTRAKYSRTTTLPITADEAAKHGMILVKTPTVLIIKDGDYDNLQILKNAFRAADYEVTISPTNGPGFDGSLNLSGFDSILHLDCANTVYNQDVPKAGQAALTAFVKNGGTYVQSVWASYSYTKRALLQDLNDLTLLTYDSDTVQTPVITPTAAGKESSLFDGLTAPIQLPSVNVNMGGIKVYTTTTAVSFGKSANGTDLVVARKVGAGTVVAIGYGCDDSKADFLKDATVQRIYMNALAYGH